MSLGAATPDALILQADDLEAAAAAGIITPEQATALRTFAAERTRERAIGAGHEERFRFMRGFNDFFFAIGVLLLAAGIPYFVGFGTAGMVIAAALMWGLAEVLVGRMRLVLPGILLAALFVLYVFIAAPVGSFGHVSADSAGASWYRGRGVIDTLRLITSDAPLSVILRALSAAVAAGAFYARFRLPFALLPLAVAVVIAALAVAARILPANISAPAQSLILLACGLGVFAVAMWFDSSDRERLTRRADSAFWLHLLAAPLLVHALIGLVTDRSAAMTSKAALLVLAVVAVLTLVAVAIDRRALLVSALTYLGLVIGYALNQAAVSTPNQATVFAATLVLLGALVLSLGIGWMPLRQALMSALPDGLTRRLPPTPSSATVFDNNSQSTQSP